MRNLKRVPFQVLDGKHVKLLCDIERRDGVKFSAGTEMIIRQKYSGLSLATLDERGCYSICRVGYDEVELIEQPQGHQ